MQYKYSAMAKIRDLIPTTVLFKKEKTDSILMDLVEDFDMALIEYSIILSGGSKDLYVNDWKDQDGEEVFIPERLYLKAYDISMTFGIKGTVNDYLPKWIKFDNYLTGKDGSGAEFTIFSPWYNIGRQHCYAKDYKAKESNREIGGNLFHTFERPVRITDPATFIDATIDKSGNYQLQIRE